MKASKNPAGTPIPGAEGTSTEEEQRGVAAPRVSHKTCSPQEAYRCRNLGARRSVQCRVMELGDPEVERNMQGRQLELHSPGEALSFEL